LIRKISRVVLICFVWLAACLSSASLTAYAMNLITDIQVPNKYGRQAFPIDLAVVALSFFTMGVCFCGATFLRSNNKFFCIAILTISITSAFAAVWPAPTLFFPLAATGIIVNIFLSLSASWLSKYLIRKFSNAPIQI
jgi:hypothetical protein